MNMVTRSDLGYAPSPAHILILARCALIEVTVASWANADRFEIFCSQHGKCHFCVIVIGKSVSEASKGLRCGPPELVLTAHAVKLTMHDRFFM